VVLLRHDTLSLEDDIRSIKTLPLSVPEAEAGPRLRVSLCRIYRIRDETSLP
jgi:hypothetical protein